MALAENRREARTWRCMISAFACCASLMSCQAAARAPKTPQKDPGVRTTAVQHEECDVTSSAERFDANGDGIPELSRSHQGRRPVCEAFDLNQDGMVDIWAYYGADGRIRRRELAYGRDARISEIRLYKGGLLSEIQQATSLDGKLDTWQLFAGGQRVRTERDTDGDGRVDEWWEYPDPSKPDCPLMYRDENEDGKPERNSGVDLCASGYVPPERSAPRPVAPRFEREAALPEELDQGAESAPPVAPKGGPPEGEADAKQE